MVMLGEPENSGTDIEESFVIEFKMFMTLVARVVRRDAGRNKRFRDHPQFDEMLSNIDDARDRIIDREIIKWLTDVLGIYRRRYGLGADIDIRYIKTEMANFNRTLLDSGESGESYVRFTSEQMIDAAENVSDGEVDDDTVNQAKNIKDSIEMMLNDVEKLPVGKQIVRLLRGKQDKKRGKIVGAVTRYFNEMLKFAGAN